MERRLNFYLMLSISLACAAVAVAGATIITCKLYSPSANPWLVMAGLVSLLFATGVLGYILGTNFL